MRKSWITTLLLLLTLGVFEVFNYSVTVYAWIGIVGKGFWAIVLTGMCCAIDPIVVIKIRKRISAGAGGEVLYGFAVWALIAAGCSILTWYAISIAAMSSPNASEFLVHNSSVIAFWIALVAWIIRVAIVAGVTFSNSTSSKPARVVRRTY